MRAKEMEKMKEEMRMYKEKQRQDMIRREQEERLKAGWMVTEFVEEVKRLSWQMGSGFSPRVEDNLYE